MNAMWASKQKGFTLVELLIVIVIIAILAAITIVAYNGITARAKLAQQVSEMDKIGKAIQLWSAEKGTTLGHSDTGYGGRGVGTFIGKGAPYGTLSVQELLQNAGYLPGSIGGSAFSVSSVMVAPCIDYDTTRWVVLATVSPVPAEPVAQQITDTGCTNSILTTYTGSPYNRNLVRAY